MKVCKTGLVSVLKKLFFFVTSNTAQVLVYGKYFKASEILVRKGRKLVTTHVVISWCWDSLSADICSTNTS